MGRKADAGMALRDQASLSALTEDVVKTSEIEGEQLNVESVRSSQATLTAVDNSAPLANRPESTYKSGKVVQTNGATSSSRCDSI